MAGVEETLSKEETCDYCRCKKKKYYHIAVMEEECKIPFCCPTDWLFTGKDDDGNEKVKCYYPGGFSVEEMVNKIQRCEPFDENDERWKKFNVVLIGHKSCKYQVKFCDLRSGRVLCDKLSFVFSVFSF